MTFSRLKHAKKPMAEMNVVPFIDVMLVLLVIFMITAPLLTQGVKVDLPQASANSLPDKDPVIVTIDGKGNFYLNIADKPHLALTERSLRFFLSKEVKDLQARQVMVRGDKNVNYGKIMEAMVILQHAGASNVGLITQGVAPTQLAEKN